MYQAILLLLANQDISEAAMWYNSKRDGLGFLFIEQVQKHISFIQSNPEAIAIRYNSTRTIVLKTFPFLIHYTIDKENSLIVISAVLHTSRNPKEWKR